MPRRMSATFRPPRHPPASQPGGRVVSLLGRYAGQAPGDYRVVSGVEYFDLTGGGDVAEVVSPVGAVAQEDTDAGAAFGAKRLGFLAGVLVVDGIEFGFVQHGVADGGEVHRQP